MTIVSAQPLVDTACAPGKILWAGEYAVLGGGPAVVQAVDRWAWARPAPHADPNAAAESPFLHAAALVLRERLGDGPELARLLSTRVDTTDFRRNTDKLGLGSSAAATVAALARALTAAAPVADHQRLLWSIAHQAHGDAQAAVSGQRGSGADVAACVLGGLLLLEPRVANDDAPPFAPRLLTLPPDLAVLHLYSGRGADTRALLARVAPLEHAQPSVWRARRDELAQAARSLARALDASDAGACIAAIAEGAQALAALGRDAAAPLIPEHHGPLAEMARALGGALKPTGAGGGDMLLGVFPTPQSATACANAARQRGLEALVLYTAAGAVARAGSPVGSLADPGRSG